jgi:uncharacterized protein YodC (DUF2158 family)
MVCFGSSRPEFNKGDKVRVKAKLDVPTMTVECVSLPCYFSGTGAVPYDPMFTLRYRCRWVNQDGIESVGMFQAEELDPVPVELPSTP